MQSKEWKPWEWYPHIWKTEASFWSYLRGALRRGIWEKSPVKLDFKNTVVDTPPDDYTGKAKSGQYCALSGVWTGKSRGEVDHKDGHKSVLSEEDILPFIKHLVPHPDNMQFVDKEAHKIKSYAERKGITFEEAQKEKAAIEKQKQPVAKQKEELLANGFTEDEISNDKKRRQCFIKLVEERDGN